MLKRLDLINKPLSFQLLTFGLLMMSSTLIFGLFAQITAPLLFGDFGNTVIDAAKNSNHSAVNYLKYLQLFTAVGLFVVPPIIFAAFMGKGLLTYFGFNKIKRFDVIIYSSLLMFIAIPAINGLYSINQQMTFPSFMKGIEQWMRDSEESNKFLQEAFLNSTTIRGLAVNLFVVALLAAFGEELLFRGVIQRLLIDNTNKKHLSIIITAFIFSAIHFQFYGFIPRFLLGIVFGYLYTWSGTLWLPIIAHFTNNAAAVIFSFFYFRGNLNISPDNIGSYSNTWIMSLISAAICGLILMTIYKKTSENKESSEVLN